MIRRTESRPEVLLIDDDEDEFLLLKQAFLAYSAQFSLRYLAATTELLTSLQTLPNLPSLILLDMNMPGVDGLDVLAFLKHSAYFKAVPIIIWSGLLEDAQVNRCYEAGASSVIFKSSDQPGLEQAIQQLCDYWFVTVQLPIHSKSVA